MSISSLIKNRLERVKGKKEIIVLGLILMPIVILIAVLLAGRLEMKANIAVISNNPNSVPTDSKFAIEVMSDSPGVADLALGNYDYIVEQKEDGTYDVETVIKSDEDRQIVEDFFNKGISTKHYEDDEKVRGLGTKVIGIIAMLIFMQAVALTVFYPEDRSSGILKRILMAPVEENKYIFAQGIFTFVALYIPTYLAVIITKTVFGVNIGYSIGMMGILIALISFLATSFALFISSVARQNISLIGSAIAIVTSLLGGCFGAFTTKNSIFNLFCNLIPQTAYMKILEGVEAGGKLLQYKVELANICLWTILFLFIGIHAMKKSMRQEAC